MAHSLVLYVDNNFDAKKRTAILLFSNDFEVLPLSNLKEAQACLRIVRPDLIICAMYLADGDADQLIQTLKASGKKRNIPVMVVAERLIDEDRQRVLKLGAAAYLSKDEQSTPLLEMVQKTIALHREEFTETSASISGQLAKLKIVDLIRHLAKEHGSGCIAIEGHIPMEIHLRDGEIVHAQHGITIGKKALFRCLRIAEAAFNFQSEDHPIDRSLEGNLGDLLEEAKQSNEKLMANYHRLPHANNRVRILNQEAIQKTSLKPEARAALEICKKYPRIASYLERFNLPDILCYEYLVTFLERGFIELVSEKKPVKVITDGSCDLGVAEIEALGLEVLPLGLRVAKETFAGAPSQKDAELYRKKTKLLEEGKILPPPEERYLRRYQELLQEFECLSLFMTPGLSDLFGKVRKSLADFLEHGAGGQSLLASEITTLNGQTMSIGLGLLARYAANLAREGNQIETIEERVLEAVARQHMLFAVQPDRSALLRKGNTPAILYWDGTQFQVINRVGKGQSIIQPLVQEVTQRLDSKSQIHAAIGHVRATSTADALKSALTGLISPAKMPIYAIGPIFGHKLGEGAVGIAFFQVAN